MSFGSGISWSYTLHRQGFWPRINCSQMKLPDFKSPSCDNLSKSANFGLSKWIFCIKIIQIFLKKILIEEYQFWHTFFCKKHSLLTSILKPLYLKFGHSEKTKKFETSNHVGDCFKFCGLLIKPELYRTPRKHKALSWL